MKSRKEENKMKLIKAVMAGSVWKVLVQPGDLVEVGQDVMILESMKMEIPVSAEISGKVKEVKTNEGDFVNEEDVLVELE
ncbi:MAG TPA: acetyl-CoA carboxylase biotin carboxyl carrier protein subunit [Bacillota bacterium]|nr:acetyl-CoA carboxylase biotin carboxyl carrier protein subunit [Bacillota bacterium]